MVSKIPTGFRREPLAKLGTFLKGRGGSKTDDEETGIPVVRYGELYTTHHDVIRGFQSYVSEARAEDYTRLHVGDVLFAGSGETLEEIGKSAAFLGPDPALGSGDIIIFRPGPRVDPRYLGYASNSVGSVEQKKRMGQGSSVMHIYAHNLEKLQLSVPPIAEQRKIAAILSSVDQAIQANLAVIEQSKRVKEGLLRSLLTKGIGHTRFKRPSGWVVGRLPEVDRIPDSWEVVPLTSVARLESGHTPSRNVPEYWNGEVQWLSLHDTSAMEAHVITSTALTITLDGIANSSARLLPRGTVALSRTATIGKCVILGTRMATSQDFACYICGERLHNKFLLHLFRYMKHVWMALSGGSTHRTVYMPDFEKLQITLPPVDEQMQLASLLDAFDNEILNIRKLVNQQQQTKAGLLQDLVTGKVRVSV